MIDIRDNYADVRCIHCGEYNRLIIRKRILRRNIFFGWYVHSPDLPVIELKEIIQD